MLFSFHQIYFWGVGEEEEDGVEKRENFGMEFRGWVLILPSMAVKATQLLPYRYKPLLFCPCSHVDNQRPSLAGGCEQRGRAVVREKQRRRRSWQPLVPQCWCLPVSNECLPPTSAFLPSLKSQRQVKCHPLTLFPEGFTAEWQIQNTMARRAGMLMALLSFVLKGECDFWLCLLCVVWVKSEQGMGRPSQELRGTF